MTTTSRKTLNTARKASYFGKKMYSDALIAADEGRPTAWVMMNFGPADLLLKAFGVEMVYPENWGAYCASRRHAEVYLNASDSEGFPASLCGYARNCIGYTKLLSEANFAIPEDTPGGGMPKPVVLVGSGLMCDARYKWFQALQKYMDVPTYVLEMPCPGVKEGLIAGAKTFNVKYMANECRKFIGFMEELLGKKLDWDRLKELLYTYEQTLRITYSIDQLRKAIPSPMLAQDYYSCMLGSLFMAYDPEALAFYKEVYDEVKYKVDNNIGAISNEKYRVLFGEIPPWHSLGFFDELADDYGIAIVMETSLYHNNLPPNEDDLSGAKDVLERICYWTYQHLTGHYILASKKMGVEPSFLVQPYLDWAKDYSADGVLFHETFSCRPVCYTMLHTAKILKERLNLPSLFIEGDMVDVRVFNEQETTDKIYAFLETMDYYKELRERR